MIILFWFNLIKIKIFTTFSLQDDSIEIIDKQTACTDKAGDQSSVNIDKHM